MEREGTLGTVYRDLWWGIHTAGQTEESRNGRVITIQEPVTATITNPLNNLLVLPKRNVNSFFHLAEAIWILAGMQDVEFLEMFNSRYREYSEDNGTVHGAYGFRWAHHFGFDQVERAIYLLNKDPGSRQVILGMWDPSADLVDRPLRDRPCNTQIMCRVIDGKLGFTVINRSNDLVWGLAGANVFTLTVVQAVLAHYTGLELGPYRVVTNNLHVYPDLLPNFEEIQFEGLHYDTPSLEMFYPDLRGVEYPEFRMECILLISYILQGLNPLEVYDFSTPWLRDTVIPLLNAYLKGPGHYQERKKLVASSTCSGLSEACWHWLDRREAVAR